MLVEMNRQSFDALTNAELVLACTEVTIHQVKGRNPTEKSQIVQALHEEQQAVFMIRLLDPARHTEIDFRSWISYLLIESCYSEGIKDGFRFFGETALLQFLDDAVDVLKEIPQHAELDSTSVLTPLFETFQVLYHECMERTGEFIRGHASQFIQLQA
ncbi:hypothetical protein P9847_12040 [Paenibacillus chibensis]|uniref:Phycobilisome protein n=1 Tax=Paenibacillus chibensis TaxID=59846 RepID=A0ABU6PVB5_9BACL|nr:hypothetical protein [Paenibacillus chibensis]